MIRGFLLAVFVTLIIAIGVFGYFYEDDPVLQIEQAIELENNRKEA